MSYALWTVLYVGGKIAGTFSMGTKRRRIASPSSSVSGDFEDATSSTPATSWKRRRTSNATAVDQVSLHRL